MKSFLFLLVILIAAGGWTANKFLQRANKSSDEKTRFIEYTKDYNENIQLFLSEKLNQHHDEAFETSYRMWILSPVSDIDLSTDYDEQSYYRALGKAIAEDAKKEGQEGAYNALVSIAKNYGIEGNGKKSTKASSPKQAPQKLEVKKDSPLSSGKLGDKRKIPRSRRTDYDR